MNPTPPWVFVALEPNPSTDKYPLQSSHAHKRARTHSFTHARAHARTHTQVLDRFSAQRLALTAAEDQVYSLSLSLSLTHTHTLSLSLPPPLPPSLPPSNRSTAALQGRTISSVPEAKLLSTVPSTIKKRKEVRPGTVRETSLGRTSATVSLRPLAAGTEYAQHPSVHNQLVEHTSSLRRSGCVTGELPVGSLVSSSPRSGYPGKSWNRDRAPRLRRHDRLDRR